MPKSANEVFRDHVRFTGDGLPNQPVGHPLPVGDPRSGIHNPSKPDIREAMGGVESDRILAEAAAALAVQAMADVHGATLFASDLSSLLADTAPSYPEGTIFATRSEGYAYEVVTSGEHLTTSGGVKLKVVPKGGTFHLGAFNPPVDGTGNASTAFNAAMIAASAVKGRLRCEGTFRVTQTVFLQDDVEVDLRGATIITDNIPVINGTVSVGGQTVTYSGHNTFVGLGKSGFRIVGGVFDNWRQTVRQTSTRAIGLYGCSKYEVRDCTFYVDGAAVASIWCREYTVQHNVAHCHPSPFNGTAAHDGVFDQWWGSRDFSVLFNRVYGNDIARYAFLWTSTTSTGNPIASSAGRFIGNYAEKCTATGLWLQGRAGVITGFQVVDNTAADIHSAAFRLTDVVDGIFSGNIGMRPRYQMLSAGAETSNGGVTGVKRVIVSGNMAHHVNREETSDLAQGAAYYFHGPSSVVFAGNTVVGVHHTRPYYSTPDVDMMAMGDGIYPNGTQGPGVRQAPPGSGRFEATVKFDNQNIDTGTQVSQSFAVAGVVMGDRVNIASLTGMAGLLAWAEVTANNTVTIYISNMTGSSRNAGPRTFYINAVARRQV